jgi:ArsR family transcriptional regulator
MKEAIRIFKALSDPTRLRILLLLLKRNLCVCELMFILEMEQSRLSHQLRILKDADLVEDLRDSRWIIYRIPAAMKRDLAGILGESLSGKLMESDVTKRDRANLRVCLREEVRKKHSSL